MLAYRTLKTTAAAIAFAALASAGAQAAPLVKNIEYSIGSGTSVTHGANSVTGVNTNFDFGLYVPKILATEIPVGFTLSSATIHLDASTSGFATFTAAGASTVSATGSIGGKVFYYLPTIGTSTSILSLNTLNMTVPLNTTTLVCSAGAPACATNPINLAIGDSLTSTFSGLTAAINTNINVADLGLLVGAGFLSSPGSPSTDPTCGFDPGNCATSVIQGFSGSGTLSTTVSVTSHGTVTYDFKPIVVCEVGCPTPEPASMTLLGAGLVALGAIVRRRRRAA